MKQKQKSFKIDFDFKNFKSSGDQSFFTSTLLQPYLPTLINLKSDLCPYLHLISLTFILVILQCFILLCLPSSMITIKSMKGFNDPLPWILSPFSPCIPNTTLSSSSLSQTNQQQISLSYIICHLIYSLIIISQIEHKLKNSLKLLLICITINFLTNIFLHFIWSSDQSISCNNITNYSLYGYLLVLDNRQHQSKKIQNMEQQYQYPGYVYDNQIGGMGKESQENQNIIIGIYKFIVFSYLVFLGLYQGTCCYFLGYLVSVCAIFLGASLNII